MVEGRGGTSTILQQTNDLYVRNTRLASDKAMRRTGILAVAITVATVASGCGSTATTLTSAPVCEASTICPLLILKSSYR